MNDIIDMRFFWGYNMPMQPKFITQVMLKSYHPGVPSVVYGLELTANDIKAIDSKAITPILNIGLRNYKQVYE